MNYNSSTRSYSSSQTAQATLFRQVYLWMAFALTITGLTAMIVANSPTLLSMIFSSQFVFWGIMIAELAVVITLSARLQTLSFSTATLMFILYSLLNGVTMSFIFLVYTQASIASTFLITAGTFGSMSLFGLLTKKDLSSWGSILFMGLIGVIIASIVNMFWANSTLYWIVSYAGVFLFVGLTAYDTQKIKRILLQPGIEVNSATQKLALMGALSLYLDFINLFLYMLRIFGNRK